MKKLITISILAAVLAAGSSLKAQDQPEEYLGLPGDNLNLYAVMKLFQESKTLEVFEKKLNEQNSTINNLDLNGDNYVDYIRVIDNIDGDVHNIVLQVPVNDKENQDVAVFTVQRFPDGKVLIQLTGDEELYGKNYIIEPIFDEENQGQTPNPGYTGNSTVISGRNVTIIRTTPVQIATWPVIRFIYSPGYSGWHSSWYWGYYPSYWHPWEPFYWHYYYGYHYNLYNNYYGHYRLWHDHRFSHWNDYYYNTRHIHSPYVSVRIQSGNYKNTYSRPEQRKEGEAVYNRAYSSDRNGSAGRRTNSNTHQVRQSGSTNPSTGRDRSTTNLNNRTVTSRQPEKNISTTVNSRTTVTNKTESRPERGQKIQTGRTSERSAGVRASSSRATGNNKAVTSKNKVEKTNKAEPGNSGRRR